MRVHAALFVCAAAAAAAAYFFLPGFFAVSYVGPAAPVALEEPVPEAQQSAHMARPEPLKGIYMSQCVSGTPSFRESLVELVDTTELNAIVIDIRDYTGKISFTTDNPALADMVSDACGARDMRTFIERLHGKGIYVVGRVTIFQNPYWSKLHPEDAVQNINGGVWHDRKGLAFVDVGATPYWDSVVELAKESYAIGFDEINFDYIRYPSDGPMAEANYTWSEGKSKQTKLEEFYKYVADNLTDIRSAHAGQPGMVLSADLFGYVTVHHDDLGIGQVLERALPYFDYVYPMVYPSHYNKGFAGLADPNSDVYAVVYESLVGAAARERATTTKHASLAYCP
ncbi:MAG: putative glycoside hydrolase, partial [Patescibacteria group bacterium]